MDEICQLEEEQSQVTVHIRTKVLQEGKKLRQLQKWQKAEQKAAKERGEEAQTWKDFVAQQKQYRVLFPSEHACRQYMRISQFPGAYGLTGGSRLRTSILSTRSLNAACQAKIVELEHRCDQYRAILLKIAAFVNMPDDIARELRE